MYFDEILTHTFVTDIKFWLNSIYYDLNSDILRLLILKISVFQPFLVRGTLNKLSRYLAAPLYVQMGILSLKELY